MFDFEDWTPVWAQNIGSGSWHSSVYQTASEELVKAAHPTWNSSQVYAAAKQEFEAAALNFMVQTLKVVKELRPNAKTGFYGCAVLGVARLGRALPGCTVRPTTHANPRPTRRRLPANPIEPCAYEHTDHPECGYNCPIFGDIYRAENDAIQALWDESTALFPSIYLPPFTPSPALQNYVNGTVTVRGWRWKLWNADATVGGGGGCGCARCPVMAPDDG